MSNHNMRHEAVTGAFPRRVEIEIASACNLRCTYCPRKFLGRLNGFMDFSLFVRLIDEIARYPETILVLHRRGESLLHPDFVKMCVYVGKKFKEVQLATNATLLDEERARAIIGAVNFVSFSIDAPAAFDRTRVGARYVETESKILRFLKMNNGRVRTQVSMVKTKETPAGDIAAFKRIWDGKVNRIRIYDEHSADGRFGSLKEGREKRVPCAMPFYELLVYCDGKTGRCNHDWAGEPMGDVNNFTIEEIWQGPRYNALRDQHRSLDIEDRVCKNCDSWYPEAGRQGTGEVIE